MELGKKIPRAGAGLRPSTLYVQSRMVNWHLHKNILVLFSVHYHECEGSIQKKSSCKSRTNKVSKSELYALQIYKLECLKQAAKGKIKIQLITIPLWKLESLLNTVVQSATG